MLFEHLALAPSAIIMKYWFCLSKRAKQRVVMLFILAFVGSMLSGYAVFVEPRMITIAEYEIVSENLPDAFDGKRIALITDIHHGTRLSYNLLDKIVRLTNEQSPDLILLGGDYTYERPEPLAECFAKLSEWEAPLGVFAVLGNHDYWRLPLVRKTIHDTGIELLEDDTVWLEEGDDRILLVGVADARFGKPSLIGMQQELAESDFTVVLSHTPDFYYMMTPEERDHIDLMLSGHTHGGQITVFGFYAPIKTADAKFLAGHLKLNDGQMTMIVSNGVGTAGLPIRFFARPQIVLVTLKKKT